MYEAIKNPILTSQIEVINTITWQIICSINTANYPTDKDALLMAEKIALYLHINQI